MEDPPCPVSSRRRISVEPLYFQPCFPIDRPSARFVLSRTRNRSASRSISGLVPLFKITHETRASANLLPIPFPYRRRLDFHTFCPSRKKLPSLSPSPPPVTLTVFHLFLSFYSFLHRARIHCSREQPPTALERRRRESRDDSTLGSFRRAKTSLELQRNFRRELPARRIVFFSFFSLFLSSEATGRTREGVI